MAYSKSKERMAYSLWQKRERGSHRLDALTIRYKLYSPISDIRSQQDAEKVRQPVLFIWSIQSVSIVWLNQTDPTDQIDQRDPPPSRASRARVGT